MQSHRLAITYITSWAFVLLRHLSIYVNLRIYPNLHNRSELFSGNLVGKKNYHIVGRLGEFTLFKHSTDKSLVNE